MAVGETSLESAESSWLLTARQVAEWLQVSQRTLWRMRSAGQIPEPVRFGGTVRWRKDELREWLAAGCPARRKPR